MSLGKSHQRFLIAVLIFTLIVRGGVLILGASQLSQDVDAYRGIAQEIAAGHGFSSPGGETPTAYRPPLYPILLALAFFAPANWGIAVLHLALGVATVLLTWRLGMNLRSETAAKWAACLVALDPLLVQYSTQPMTETLCAFLAVGALNLMVPMPSSKWKTMSLGILLGLCILSRPTFLVFAALAILVWLVLLGKTKQVTGSVWVVLLALLSTIAPWMIRNALVFGEPRITTTHGGYTLLLGNNPIFYREVVEAPFGTTWEGESLARWQASLEEEMKNADPEVKTEPERDRYLAQKARRHIAENPGLFLRACWLRFLRFWNIFPPETALDAVENLWRKTSRTLGFPASERAAEIIARTVWGSVGLFYAAIIGSFFVRLFRLNRNEWCEWWPLVLMILGFCAVHLVYWSNTRMRAPVMPAIILLAVRAWASPSAKSTS